MGNNPKNSALRASMRRPRIESERELVQIDLLLCDAVVGFASDIVAERAMRWLIRGKLVTETGDYEISITPAGRLRALDLLVATCGAR